MKKIICVFLFIFCLLIQPIYASSTSLQSYTIDQNSYNERHQVTIQVEPLTSLSQQIIDQHIEIVNLLSYDLQLISLKIQAPEAVQKDILFTYDMNLAPLQNHQNDYHLNCYSDNQSHISQTLNKFISQQRIISQQTLKLDFQYDISLVEEKSLSDIQIILEFAPIILQGYIYNDLNHSGQWDDGDSFFDHMKVDLWQGNSLIATTLTSQDGYYQFLNQSFDEGAYLEIQTLDDYRIMQYDESHLFKEKDQKIMSSSLYPQEITQDLLLGFVQKSYQLHYQIQGAKQIQSVPQQLYEKGTVITTREQGDLSQEGYSFVGWNTKQDGTGTMYQPNTTMIMPNHDVTLYAIWQSNSLPQKQYQQIQKSSNSLFQVETSDEAPIVVLLLMALAAIGVFIICKALKQKNR